MFRAQVAMADILIGTLFLLFFLGVMCLGLLALVAPDKALRLLAWWSGVRKWPKVGSAGWLTWHWPWRVGGFLMALVSAVVVTETVPAFVEQVIGRTTPVARRPEPLPEVSDGSSPLSLLIAIVMFLGGFYCLMRPKAVATWAAHLVPGRVAPEEVVDRSVPMARIGGLFMIIGGVAALLAWLNSG
jgi:hypothetical protein